MTIRPACMFLVLSVAGLGCGSGNGPNPGPKGAQAAAGGSTGAGGVAGTSGSTGAGGSAGAGGATGAGGSTGAGGTAAADAAVVPSCITIADDLIADFTNDGGLSLVDGRSGGFYVYGDANGAFDPPPADPDAGVSYPIDTTTGNTYCSGPGSFHVKASGFSLWGAALAADFVPKQGDFKGTYDASKYKGVSFWAKAAAPIAGMLVSFPDIYTSHEVDPAALAALDSTLTQTCVYNAFATNNCSPYLVKFGDGQFPLYATYQVGTTWKRFDVLFADTQQDKYNAGYHTAANKIDTTHLTGMAIQVNAHYDAAGNPSANDFELWIDDVNFIE